MSDVLPDVLLLLIDSVVDSDVLELVGEVDEVSVLVEDRDVLLTVLLLVDFVVVSDVLVPVLEEEVLMLVEVIVDGGDSGVLVEVDRVVVGSVEDVSSVEVEVLGIVVLSVVDMVLDMVDSEVDMVVDSEVDIVGSDVDMVVDIVLSVVDIVVWIYMVE